MVNATSVLFLLSLGITLVVFIEVIIIGNCTTALRENSRVLSAQLDLLLRAQGVPYADRQKVCQSGIDLTGASPDMAMNVVEGEN